MIELYRRADCPQCADIEAELRELVVAHKVIIIEERDMDPALMSSRAYIVLPALKDNGNLIEGVEAIRIYLQELDEFVASGVGSSRTLAIATKTSEVW